MNNPVPLPALPADPAAPLILHVPLAQRRLEFLLGALLLLGGIGALAFLLSRWAALSNATAAILAFGGLYAIASGLWKMATALRYRVTLTQQTLATRHALGTQAIARAEVLGYASGGDALLFISCRGQDSLTQVAHGLQHHDAVTAWKQGLANLDAPDVDAALEARIEALYEQESGGHARALVDQCSKMLLLAKLPGTALILFAVLLPQSALRGLLLSLVALVPLAALELHRRYPGLITLWTAPLRGVKPDLTLAVLLPSTGLILLALHERWPVPWMWWLPATPVLALALAAGFGFLRKGRAAAISSLLLLLPYAAILLLVLATSVMD
jgi:hypothetical protein